MTLDHEDEFEEWATWHEELRRPTNVNLQTRVNEDITVYKGTKARYISFDVYDEDSGQTLFTVQFNLAPQIVDTDEGPMRAWLIDLNP